MIAADSASAFLDDGPTTTFVRQVLGAVAELDKAMTVAKLRGARERKRQSGIGRWTGRKSHAELHPQIVAEAKRLHRASPKTGVRRSLREIASELEKLGHTNVHGRPFHPESVRAMLD
jgi:DNA invertase Pin-like site-specific DNA recombinase